jgi:hypothetical protein
MKTWLSSILALLLAACAMNVVPNNGPHLSAAQCTDLTALRHHEPLTRARNSSELAALEAAGYDPFLYYDPYYPDDLQAAQRQVDIWYQTDCQQTTIN